MDIILTDITALQTLRELRIARTKLQPSSRKNISSCISNVNEIKVNDLQFLFTSYPIPLQLLTRSLEAHSTSKKIHQSFWRGELPTGSIIKTDIPHVLCCSPVMCALQLSRHWPLSYIALLICEFCGNYSCLPAEKAWVISKPIATIDEFKSFCKDLGNRHFASKRFKQAIELAENGSNSPFESQVRILLEADQSMGGYGCSGSVFNYPVIVAPLYGAGAPQKNRYLDLCWPDKKIGVECDGGQHLTTYSRDYDSTRDRELYSEGFVEKRISSYQLDSFNEVEIFGTELRELLGDPAPSKFSTTLQIRKNYWHEIVASPWNHLPMNNGTI